VVSEPAPEPQPIVVPDALREALTLTSPAWRRAAVLLVRLELPAEHGLTWQDHGELILSQVSEQLSATRRCTDRVVPMDSGSCVVVCLDVDSAASAERVASAVTRELSRPFTIGEADVPLGTTIGIVLTDSGQDVAQFPEALLEDAWVAARMAAEEGRPWRLFDDSIAEGARLRQRLLRAMDNGELDLDFQKVVDLQSGKVVGAEAYLRWRRPDDQAMCAAEFLDKAYEADMAAPLGRWVLDRALSELASWRAGNALAEHFKLFVNVGAEELAVPEFAETVEKLLREHGVAPTMLAVEMPETALSEAVADAHALRALRSLGDLGVDCVVDDFGTGRSNLDWLHALPVTGLKIHPELVSILDHSEDRRGPALVRGIIALGHELQMTVVGEGVESASQEVALRAMGCDLAQGHHLGRPERSAQLATALA
jgi:EAL domain-containing protein (putative c-di-GMP-specific phosphodiesterase class I)